MHLSFLLWVASLLPQSAADPLCLASTVYLEARDQSQLGQRAVAEVALRREEDGRWGDSVCEVVTAPKQFAPTLVNPNIEMGSLGVLADRLRRGLPGRVRTGSCRKASATRSSRAPSHFAAHYVHPSGTATRR
jgi:spore germination cell wall hydrolase CwlJ-like protein